METSYILNNKLPVQLISDVVQNRKQKLARPKSLLEIESFIYSSPFFAVSSIGDDGNVYGTASTFIMRTTDSMVTTETGFDFSTVTTHNPVFATKTPKGYVVMCENGEAGSVWFSTDFNSGFTMVQDIPNGRPSQLTRSWYHKFDPQFVTGQTDPGYSGIVMVGEYTAANGKDGKPRRVFASFDGGETWNTIFTAELRNASQNLHIHATAYDPYRGRMWVSVGDLENGQIYRSDDLGATWKEVNLQMPRHVNFNKDDILTQPTFLIPLKDKVAMSPDKSQVPGVASILIDDKYIRPNTEKYLMEWNHSVCDGIHSGTMYGTAPYVLDNDVAYAVFNATGIGTSFVVATGDGGNSWHKVLTLNHHHIGGDGMTKGIVGVDKNGYLFAYYRRGTATRNIKMKALEWEYI